ncbi:MAG: protein kinase [Lachnospiraceae bacterium]|nr:protein kinase [Lachnospiraceae bacterium]
MNVNSQQSLPPIPGYEIRGRIGAGGGGTVYRAWHCNLRKDVIIKRIHDKITDEEQQRTEADILKNLHHPYLPQVFDYFVIDGVAYTVMDFIEGESLQKMLNRGVRFSEKQVLKYARQLTEAVDYLHSRRVPIIHGDIKPDNIMHTPEDNICLIDFNISGISTDGNAYTFGYSPGFSAPEQHDAFVTIQRQMRADGSFETLNRDRYRDPEATAGSAAADTEELTAGARYAEDGTEILDYGADDTEVLEAYAPAETPETYAPTEVLTEVLDPAGPTEVLTESLEPQRQTESLEPQRRTEPLNPPGQSRTYSRPSAYDTAATKKIRLNNGIAINRRSDVYSCGATLYYLYTGEVFDPDRDNLLRSGTSEGFIYVLNRALQRDPARRFADGGQMRRALDQLHKNNRSYRRMMIGQTLVKLLLLVFILIGVGLILSGRAHWKKEMEQEYNSYIVDLNEYRREDKEKSFEKTFDAATELFPERIEAWYQKTLYLYEQGKYENTVEFFDKEIPLNDIVNNADEEEADAEKDDVTFANLYSVVANAYFELGEYKDCENYMATAIRYDDRNPEFYVTRAIALARLGETEKAEQLLEKAIKLKVSNDNLNLARGEIAYARGEYAEAAELLKACTEETDDDYRLLRAAIRCAEAINAQKPEKSGEDVDDATKDRIRDMTDVSTAVLQDAVDRLPGQYRRMLLHQLSFQYTDAYNFLGEEKYGEAAIEVLKRIDEEGYAGFETYCTMVNLYTSLEHYDEEQELLDRMDKEYPDHYLIPLYKAMLTAKLESLKPTEEQDFSLFVEYYNEAERRIAELDPALRVTEEIEQLESTYNELVTKGRI